MSSTRIRVLLADDHPVVLTGIKALLATAPDIDIVATAGDGLEALRLVTDLQPDVAVLDMSMPGLNGIGVATRLHENGSPCKVIAMTMHEEPAYVRQLLELGMSGYVLKRSAVDDLVRAIHVVRDGGVYCDPAITSQIVNATARRRSDTAAATTISLSDREEDVLRLTAQGHNIKEIARQLQLSGRTVETYKARGMEKLRLRSRVDVIRHGVAKGWLNDC